MPESSICSPNNEATHRVRTLYHLQGQKAHPGLQCTATSQGCQQSKDTPESHHPKVRTLPGHSISSHKNEAFSKEKNSIVSLALGKDIHSVPSHDTESRVKMLAQVLGVPCSCDAVCGVRRPIRALPAQPPQCRCPPGKDDLRCPSHQGKDKQTAPSHAKVCRVKKPTQVLGVRMQL